MVDCGAGASEVGEASSGAATQRIPKKDAVMSGTRILRKEKQLVREESTY
jgi:hypothetical protein